METYSSLIRFKLNLRFKSYYVVWKLLFYFDYAFKNVMFKSYYVVWKLGYFVDENKYISGV